MTCIYLDFEVHEEIKEYIKDTHNELNANIFGNYPFSKKENTIVVMQEEYGRHIWTFCCTFDESNGKVLIASFLDALHLANLTFNNYECTVDNVSFTEQEFADADFENHILSRLTFLVYFPYVREFLNGSSYVKREKVKKILLKNKIINKGDLHKILCLSKNSVEDIKINYEQIKSKHRYHLCMGHWRKLPDKTIWIKAHYRGDKSLGTIHKDYAVEL